MWKGVHKCAVLLPGAEVHRTGRNCCCKGGEQSEAAALEMGSYSSLEGGVIIYGAVLQTLLYLPCTPLVCRLEMTSEALPVSQEAREELQKVLMEEFLALVRENAREEMVLDMGEGRGCSDLSQEGTGEEAKTNAQSAPLPVRDS